MNEFPEKEKKDLVWSWTSFWWSYVKRGHQSASKRTARSERRDRFGPLKPVCWRRVSIFNTECNAKNNTNLNYFKMFIKFHFCAKRWCDKFLFFLVTLASFLTLIFHKIRVATRLRETGHLMNFYCKFGGDCDNEQFRRTYLTYTV